MTHTIASGSGRRPDGQAKGNGGRDDRRYHGWRRALLALSLLAPFADAAERDDWSGKMQPITPLGYVAQHTATPIVIDGKLDDEAWGHAAWTSDFVDIEGDAKPRPRFRTRAKMRWDDNYLYVAAEMEEPHVWGTLTKHDSVIFHDPDFEVFIDPDGDTHAYYEFEINALNTGWDLRLVKPYMDGGPPLNEWEIPGLKTAVHIRGTLNDPADTDRGWSVEIAFPWAALDEFARHPGPPVAGEQWRINFSRVQWHITIEDGKYRKVPNTPEDNWVWTPQGVIDMHRPEMWGLVQFAREGNAAASAAVASIPGKAARDLLLEIYYAQRDFFKVHQRWAATLDELGWSAGKLPAGVDRPVLSPTAEGYECSVAFTEGESPLRRTWRIRQDRLLTLYPAPSPASAPAR